jgi:hypothetical protein
MLEVVLAIIQVRLVTNNVRFFEMFLLLLDLLIVHLHLMHLLLELHLLLLLLLLLLLMLLKHSTHLACFSLCLHSFKLLPNSFSFLVKVVSIFVLLKLSLVLSLIIFILFNDTAVSSVVYDVEAGTNVAILYSKFMKQFKLTFKTFKSKLLFEGSPPSCSLSSFARCLTS